MQAARRRTRHGVQRPRVSRFTRPGRSEGDMRIAEFKLERAFARYEFTARYLLSPSDCESLTLGDLLAHADVETRQLWEELRLGYTESPGHPLLRQEIVAGYAAIGAGQVVIAAPEELIFIAMNSLLEPGDHVVCLAPAYQPLFEVARSIGCEMAFWPLEPAGDGWELDLERLEALIRPTTRLLVVNFPHNPTGFLPSPAAFRALIEIADRRKLYLFSDEMYRLLEYDPARRLPPACDRYEQAITLSGLSKSYGLPGLRLGWLATRDPLLPPRWLRLKDYTTICNSAPAEILGLIALRAAEAILGRNRGIIAANLHRTDAFFAERPARFRWLRPQAGPIAFPQWLGQRSVDELCRQAVEEAGVMVVPGSLFDFPGGHFRLGLGRADFPAALAAFGLFLDK